MQPLLIICNVLLVIDALALIVAVLMQQGNVQNLGAIGGGAETFFGKNKARSYEGKLELLTKITAAAFIVLAIVSTAMTARIDTTATTASASDSSDSVDVIEPELIEDEAAEADGTLEMEITDVTPSDEAPDDLAGEASPDAGDTP